MSMLDAILNKYSSLPSPNKPITKGTKPPYGTGPNRSKNMDAPKLISKLLGGTFEKDNLINHIDVWGEGRRDDSSVLTGFEESFNINLPQGITTHGKTEGWPIPNLLPIISYSDTFDLIPSGSVRYVTIMGAPIVQNIAKEMGRILYDYGMIICFGCQESSSDIKTLETALGSGFVRYDHYQRVWSSKRISLKPAIAYVKRGHRTVSWEDGFQTNSSQKNNVDGKNVISLPEGEHVVSWDDCYKTCKVGSKVDGKNVVILQNNGKVVSWNDGYITCAKDSKVDKKNVVILQNNGKVVSWDNGYITCKKDSRVDDSNVVILSGRQSVVSWDDGYKTCKVGGKIDGTNVIVKAVGQEVLAKEADGSWRKIKTNEKIDNESIILAWRLWNGLDWDVIKTTSSENISTAHGSADDYPSKDEI